MMPGDNGFSEYGAFSGWHDNRFRKFSYLRIDTNYCNNRCSALYCSLINDLNEFYADRGKKSSYDMH